MFGDKETHTKLKTDSKRKQSTDYSVTATEDMDNEESRKRYIGSVELKSLHMTD